MNTDSQQHPGLDEAAILGYTLHSYGAGICSAAVYTNKGLSLTIERHGSSTGLIAELWARIGLVEIKIGSFAFPHPLFKKFEAQMLAAVEAVKNVSV